LSRSGELYRVANPCFSGQPKPHRSWPGRALAALRAPIRGLPARAIVCIFGAAFFASLAVALISTWSIGSFLRDEVSLSFPALLDATAERLDLWLSLRRLDVAEFAEGAALVDSARAVGSAHGGVQGELRDYLARLRRHHPVYDGLFLLDADGGVLASDGELPEFGEMARRQLAVAMHTSGVVDRWRAEHRAHLFSAPVPADPPRSLHGVVGLEALRDALSRVQLGGVKAVYLVDRSGGVLAAVGAEDGRRRHERLLPAPDSPLHVEEYENDGGEVVVGSALTYERFGWTLVVEELAEISDAPVTAVLRRILAINLAIALLFSVIALLLSGSALRPLHRLYTVARRIADGEIGVALPEQEGQSDPIQREVGVVSRAFNEMGSRLLRYQQEIVRRRREIDEANERLLLQNDQLRRANEELEQLSITDELTRLHNHRFFRDQLPREMKRSLRTGSPLALVLFDIDDFKLLNDRFGHALGDAVLRRVAEVMSDQIREVDLLARYGGEEFALLATGTTLAGAVALAQKVRLAVGAARFSIVDLDGPVQVGVTLSAGVACFHGDEKALFNDADRALYQAKAAGKDCVCST
jgi:diguanylate cyclase